MEVALKSLIQAPFCLCLDLLVSNILQAWIFDPNFNGPAEKSFKEYGSRRQFSDVRALQLIVNGL